MTHFPPFPFSLLSSGACLPAERCEKLEGDFTGRGRGGGLSESSRHACVFVTARSRLCAHVSQIPSVPNQSQSLELSVFNHQSELVPTAVVLDDIKLN